MQRLERCCHGQQGKGIDRIQRPDVNKFGLLHLLQSSCWLRCEQEQGECNFHNRFSMVPVAVIGLMRMKIKAEPWENRGQRAIGGSGYGVVWLDCVYMSENGGSRWVGVAGSKKQCGAVTAWELGESWSRRIELEYMYLGRDSSSCWLPLWNLGHERLRQAIVVSLGSGGWSSHLKRLTMQWAWNWIRNIPPTKWNGN